MFNMKLMEIMEQTFVDKELTFLVKLIGDNTFDLQVNDTETGKVYAWTFYNSNCVFDKHTIFCSPKKLYQVMCDKFGNKHDCIYLCVAHTGSGLTLVLKVDGFYISDEIQLYLPEYHRIPPPIEEVEDRETVFDEGEEIDDQTSEDYCKVWNDLVNGDIDKLTQRLSEVETLLADEEESRATTETQLMNAVDRLANSLRSVDGNQRNSDQTVRVLTEKIDEQHQTIVALQEELQKTNQRLSSLVERLSRCF